MLEAFFVSAHVVHSAFRGKPTAVTVVDVAPIEARVFSDALIQGNAVFLVVGVP